MRKGGGMWWFGFVVDFKLGTGGSGSVGGGDGEWRWGCCIAGCEEA